MKQFQYRIVYILSLSCLLIGFALGSEKTEELQKILETYGNVLTKAVLDGDHETILSFHADDVIIMPDFQPMIKGKCAAHRLLWILFYHMGKAKG